MRPRRPAKIIQNIRINIFVNHFKTVSKYTFSGHETFACKSLWLKKGCDFVKDGHSFNDEDAVVALGVGKNMVSSTRGPVPRVPREKKILQGRFNCVSLHPQKDV